MSNSVVKIVEQWQNEDTTEPALFRLLVKKPSLDHKELAYIGRYRTAFNLELLSLLNIPFVAICLMKAHPKFNPGIRSRKTYRFLFSFFIVGQINMFLVAQYYRKIKRYPFEDELMLRYYKDLQSVKSDPNNK